MLREAREHVAALARIFGAIDLDQLQGEDALSLLGLAGEVERLGTGLKVRVAPCAAAHSAWHEDGHRSEAWWLADMTRSSVPEAAATLRAGRALSVLPATAGAAARGELSLPQLRAITEGAAFDPAAEPDLLGSAAYLSVAGLQRCARELAACRAEPEDVPAWDRRADSGLAALRQLRFWTDGTGLARFAGTVLPDSGAELLTLVRSRAAHVADEARRAGLDPEPQAAYDADALVALVRGGRRRATFDGPQGSDRTRNAAVVFHVSTAALRRGDLDPADRCDAVGVGPVAIAAVEHVLAEADLSVVDDDEWGAAARPIPPLVSPGLDAELSRRDEHCVVPECHVTMRLDTVLWRAPAAGRPVSVDHVARLCAGHHRQFTYGGYRLEGGPGLWQWVPPP